MKVPFFRTKKLNGSAQTTNYPHCRVMSDLLDPNGDAVESWRIFRIMSEFVSGFELLRRYGLAVTFFGTARCHAGDEIYKAAEELAEKLASGGFTVITGGGPGVMEAANVGAFKVGGKSVGISIKLPMEQHLNPYTTESEHFNFFFTRKVMLSFASEVYVYFPAISQNLLLWRLVCPHHSQLFFESRDLCLKGLLSAYSFFWV